MHIFKNPNFNFLRWRWIALALSAAIIALGVTLIATRGVPQGVEFSSGTNIILKFEEPVPQERIRAALGAVPGETAVQQFGDPADNQWLIRVPMPPEAVEKGDLSIGSQLVVQAVQKAGLPGFEVISTEIVSPVVGAELQRRGVYATILSILAITVYIAFRFRLSFALGSIVATFHDVLVTLTFLVLFNYEMSLNIVAAMLTMIGYSMNDMIVIFDRVRENARSRRREPLDVMINTSLNQTLTRTVITSGTLFLAVLALYLFGGEVLEGFAFTMLVGTLATTYSGWFIAPSIAIMLSQRPAVAGAAAPVAGRTPAPQEPTRRSKPQRKMRAS
jgi:preprotein translocase SecF subunit